MQPDAVLPAARPISYCRDLQAEDLSNDRDRRNRRHARVLDCARGGEGVGVLSALQLDPHLSHVLHAPSSCYSSKTPQQLLRVLGLTVL